MKMKLLLVLLAVVGLMASAVQANMLLNPSFEEGAFGNDYTPDYWTHSFTTYDPMHTWISDAAEAHWGSKYMKMNMWSWSSTAWLLQTVNVIAEQEYTFSVWAKCPFLGETSEAWAYYEYLNTESDIISDDWLPQDSDEGLYVGGNWTHVEFGAVTAPALATQVIYYIATGPENGLMGILYDDACVDTPHPSLPTPPWEAMVAIGDVDLSWTNLDPIDPNNSVYVDVLYGTEPNETDDNYNMEPLTLEPVSGQDVTSATIEGLDPNTYYWRVDSYLYGDPNEVNYTSTDPNLSPLYPIIKGYAWSFDVVSDVPPSSVDTGVDMVTWAGEPVVLDATVVDDGESYLTYAWSSDDPAGTGVVFTPSAEVEDPTATITKFPYIVAGVVNPSFEEFLIGWVQVGGITWNGVWDGTFGNKTYITPIDGDWCAYVNGNHGDSIEGTWLSQTLAETLTVDVTYSLTVEVINDGYYNEDVHYKVQLLAGGAVLAEDDDSIPLDPVPPGTSSNWETSTVVYTLGGPSDPNFDYVGEPLEIRLVCKAGTDEMNFDKVQLTGSPEFPTPEFPTVELTVRVNDNTNLTYVVKDTMTVDVYDDACTAAKAVGRAADNPGDFDGDCDTDFADLAAMAEKWLNDTGLTEPVVKP